MPRKPVQVSSEHPYLVTARCHNREWFDLPLPIVWSAFEDYLFLTKYEFELRIHAFVLMANHFHLLVSTPNANISVSMQYLLNQTSKEITKLTGRINQTYGSRHHKTLIETDHQFENCYKYLYRNPVRAGACERVQDYRFSTLHGLLGGSRLIIPVEEDRRLFTPEFDEKSLAWLNSAPNQNREDDVRKAIRRSIFKLPRCKQLGILNPLETELL